MKVIEDRTNFQTDIRYVCENCNSVFEYDDIDICYDYDIDYETKSNGYVSCPCCGHKCYVNEDDDDVTYNNIEFPKSFYQFGMHEDSCHIDNKKITTDVKECIDWLEQHPNEPYRNIGCGDTFLCVFNHEDEYYIMVAKNYYNTSIDK